MDPIGGGFRDDDLEFPDEPNPEIMALDLAIYNLRDYLLKNGGKAKVMVDVTMNTIANNKIDESWAFYAIPETKETEEETMSALVDIQEIFKSSIKAIMPNELGESMIHSPNKPLRPNLPLPPNMPLPEIKPPFKLVPPPTNCPSPFFQFDKIDKGDKNGKEKKG